LNEGLTGTDSAPPAGAERAAVSRSTVFAAAGGVTLFVVLLGVLFYTRPIKDVKPGESAHVGAAAASIGLACAATRAKFGIMIAAALRRDLPKFDSVTKDAVVLHMGDEVKVLERFGERQQNARIEVLSGKNKGRTCYTEIDAPDFLD
jgi:hypothetical protein